MSESDGLSEVSTDVARMTDPAAIEDRLQSYIDESVEQHVDAAVEAALARELDGELDARINRRVDKRIAAIDLAVERVDEYAQTAAALPAFFNAYAQNIDGDGVGAGDPALVALAKKVGEDFDDIHQTLVGIHRLLEQDLTANTDGAATKFEKYHRVIEAARRECKSNRQTKYRLSVAQVGEAYGCAKSNVYRMLPTMAAEIPGARLSDSPKGIIIDFSHPSLHVWVEATETR